eukprot:TRINITY_DN105_c0_g1_i2.p1 TRINITY_DN105_c0_g1~~TRINITY_DN105_c0_g1_i2.p1  ORF type:complete len:1400 (+),score=456.41 TRINITY_DN105_c0_g1_i2:301-4200(+)
MAIAPTEAGFTVLTTTTPAMPVVDDTAKRALPTRILLKSGYGRYLGYDRFGHIFCAKGIAGTTEEWSVEWVNEETICLKSLYGEYLAVDSFGVVRTWSTLDPAHLPYFQWQVIKVNDEMLTLKSISTEQFLIVADTGDVKLLPEKVDGAHWFFSSADVSQAGSDSECEQVSMIDAIEEEKKALSLWKPANGRLVQVSARNGKVWGVNDKANLYNLKDGEWQQVDGSLSYVTIGANGEIFGCTKYKEILEKSDDGWLFLPGQLVKLSAANKDVIWGLDERNWPWRFNGIFFSKLRKKKLLDLSVGVDGECWGILKKNRKLVRWDSEHSAWTPIAEDDNSRWMSISVYDAKNIWGIDITGRAQKFESVTKTWSLKGGLHFRTISVGSETEVYVVDANANVFSLASSDDVSAKEKEAELQMIQGIVEKLKAELAAARQQLIDLNAKFQADLAAVHANVQNSEKSQSSLIDDLKNKDKVIAGMKIDLDKLRSELQSAQIAAKLAEERALNASAAEEEKKQYEEKIKYHTWEVKVYTGDIRGAGTEANVDIVLVGSAGKSNPVRLDNSPYNFRKAREDVFSVVIEQEIGALNKIIIGHDNSGMDPSWFLERVIAFNSVHGTFKFQAGKWLRAEDDTLSLELSPIEGDFNLPKVKKYTVDVYTGDRVGAGTEANVSIVVTAEHGKYEKVLGTPAKGFVRNTKASFAFDNLDLGKLQKLRIGHDNSGFGSDWFLEKVIIRDETDAKDWYFLCGKWLKSSDGSLERDIDAAENDGVCVPPLVDYTIQVITGDRRGAGTDANVSIVIYGETDNSGVRILDTSADNFERNKTDVFGVRCVDLGKLTKIRIGHDNSGYAPGWFLDKVIIKREGTDGIYYFMYGNWLDSDNGTEKEIPASDADGKTYLPLVNYKVTVLTGNVKGAGTDADVSINIYGTNGDTGDRILDSNGNNFERGQTDVFGFDAVDLGKITKIRIGHNNKGFGAGWYLEKVTVRNQTTGEDSFFPAGRWLATDEEDGNTYCEIATEGQDSAPVAKVITYKVVVHTGDRRGAGTDARVGINITGERGDSGVRLLSNHQNNFERGRIDTFAFDCIDLGELKRIAIGHDNSGAAPGWFLSKVVVESGDGKAWTFGANRWLSVDEGDKRIQIDLAPVASDFKVLTSAVYKITVITADRPGAGTNAGVFFTLYGKEGKSREYHLDNDQDNFERNKKDVFTVESDDLGELTKVRIGHDNKGLFAAWCLDKVIVYSEKLGKNFYFLAGKWLDSTNGTIAELAASGEDGQPLAPMTSYLVKVKTGDRRFAGTVYTVF